MSREGDVLFDGDPRYVSPAAQERLFKLIEECAEVQQAATKVLRFGWDTPSPVDGETARAMLRDEVIDLMLVVGWLQIAGELPEVYAAEAHMEHVRQHVREPENKTLLQQMIDEERVISTERPR